jgi:hypothetical protein
MKVVGDEFAASRCPAGSIRGGVTLRDDFFDCLPVREDTLFELTDALLCVDEPVTTPVTSR